MEDFFGNPVDERGRPPRPPVPCPICGDGFTERAALATHLDEAHDLDERAPHGRPRAGRWQRFRRWFESLGFLPLWFVLPLNLMLVVLAWVSVTDPLFDFTSGLVVRIALLPSILLLVARVAGTKPRL